jgi:glycosyltransferase involved in cell wall biosynthesis
MKTICIVPKVSGVGGMVSFHSRFSTGLKARGVEITSDIRCPHIDALLVIGGTRDLPGLWRVHHHGIRIVQRLDGMNWLHRKLKTGVKHYLRAEYGNRVLRVIRSRFADHIVYQSVFAQGWWEDSHGKPRVPTNVVYNAVDLQRFSPDIRHPKTNWQLPSDRFRVLLIEGSLMGGYEIGLETAIDLVALLNTTYRHNVGLPVELLVAGLVSDDLVTRWSKQTDFPLIWAGLVAPGGIPELLNAAHILFSADINPACPNAVIEALACGTPVLGFDTGSLIELVTGESGMVVPYGGNPWKLEKPDIHALAEGANLILNRQTIFRAAARARAESAFGLDSMVEAYMQVLFP